MITNTKSLITAFTLASQFVDDVSVNPADDGWNICVMDPSHVALARILLKKEEFEGYAVTIPFAVNIRTLIPKLKLCGEKVDVSVEDGRFNLKSENLYQRTCLVDGSYLPSPKVPELISEVRCTVDAQYLRKSVNAVPRDVDHVVFEAQENLFRISASNDTDTAECSLTSNEYIELVGTGKGGYPLDFVQRIVKNLPAGTLVDIGMTTDNPMTIGFADDSMSVSCMIAPRIEAE